MLERIHLSIVQQVEKQGSLTAAAGVLNLTQSALSHSMKKLEQQLGTDIWLREGRSLRLTQAGQYLLAVANRVLPQLDLAEERLGQFAQGERGALRIGMECHPCYQWLLKIVAPYLASWPDVEVDVKQKFQFGGIGALFGYEIDLLVTPDPLFKPGLKFEPVFDYEQVLVVAKDHPLASTAYVKPQQLTREVLISYPVDIERLDIYSQFLLPAGVTPKRHKAIETTDIMVQMVASGRGVAALPRWLVEEYAARMDVVPVRLGARGIAKQIFLGAREAGLRRTGPPACNCHHRYCPRSQGMNTTVERKALALPGGHDKVLLHSCCAPCSGEVMEAMLASGIDYTIFFYNPNIHPLKEYELRKNENIRFAEQFGVPFVDADYDRDNWFERAKGMEHEPERGVRCTMCFDMRFERTALYAHEHGFPVITSSLGISRWKNMQQINDCGVRAAAKYSGLMYWEYNWRKGGGSARMIEISKRENFYQQEYCGCVYSLRDTNRHRVESGRERIQLGVTFYGDEQPPKD